MGAWLLRERCTAGDPRASEPSSWRNGGRGRCPQTETLMEFQTAAQSQEQNAFPVLGRQLLESLGTCGWEENAACGRASSQHPRITQRRKELARGSRQRHCSWSESEGAGRGWWKGWGEAMAGWRLRGGPEGPPGWQLNPLRAGPDFWGLPVAVASLQAAPPPQVE